jgi:4-hydroxy-tetrahydrodipicolinate synthase
MRVEHERLADAIDGGIIPATVNPFTPDYELLEDDLIAHVEDLVATDGIEAVICNAHSGECNLTDRETKRQIIETHVDAAGDTPVFSGVGGQSSLQTVEQAKMAEDAGAEALMLLPIEAYANGDPRTAIEHFERVADAVDVPLIDFQFPTWGGAAIPIEAHVEICSMEQVIAFKEASFDPVRYDRTVRALSSIRDQFTMMTGNDTFLYHAYLLGAQTGLIAYANLVPDLHVEKLRAVHAGDLDRAMEIRRRILPLTNHVFGEPQGRYLARTKAALEMIGTFEHDTLLPPQQQIGHEERAELREILQDLGEL